MAACVGAIRRVLSFSVVDRRVRCVALGVASFGYSASFSAARWLSVLESSLQADLRAVVIALTSVDLRVVVSVSVTTVSSVVSFGGISIVLFLSLVSLVSVVMIDVKVYVLIHLLWRDRVVLKGKFCAIFAANPYVGYVLDSTRALLVRCLSRVW